MKARALLSYELAPGAVLPDPPPGPLPGDVTDGIPALP